MAQSTKHIALLCPGGPITRDLAADIEHLTRAHCGERVRLHFHDQCFEADGHFAGSDARRSAAFLETANDPRFEAIWFAKGGYGACRLDSALFGQLNEHARKKTYLGYSDNGVLLGRLYKGKIGHPVHGPIAVDLQRQGGDVAIKRSLDYLTDRARSSIEPVALQGHSIVAFNINVLAHLVATDWAPDLSGHTILLEDVGEYLYRIDRAMFAIMNAKIMQGAAGICLGRISDVPENDRPFGESAEQIVKRWCNEVDVPYFGRADIGHDRDNKVVPFGLTPTT